MSAEGIYLEYFYPAVYGYTDWILKEAEKRGVKRIYFLARDMWQCYRMAGRLLKERNIDIEIRYLYVSRLSLNSKYSKEYLRQEGLEEEIDIAVADSGWLGTMQQRIESRINRHIEGFYFGLYQIPKGVDRSRYHGYYFMPTGKLKRKVEFSNSLFEVMLSAPDGMTVGYRYSNGRLMPEGSRTGNPNALMIRQFEKMLMTAGLPSNTDVKEISRRFGRLMSKPEIEEIGYVGGLKFSDRPDESGMEDIAAKWTAAEYKDQRLIRKIILKLKGRKIHESGWPYASFIENKEYRPMDLAGERVYRYLMYIRMEINEWRK